MADKKSTSEVMEELMRIAEENGVQLVAMCGDPETMRKSDFDDGATIGVRGTEEMVFYTIAWLDNSYPKVFGHYLHYKAAQHMKSIIRRLSGEEEEQQEKGEDSGKGEGAPVDDADIDAFLRELHKKGNPGNGNS